VALLNRRLKPAIDASDTAHTPPHSPDRPLSRMIRFREHGPVWEPTPGPRRVAFHHIPKTGGTSFDEWVRSFYEPHEICEQRQDDLGDLDPTGHLFYSGHFFFRMLEEKLSDAAWLVLLRDPIRRAASQYQNWHNPNRVPKVWDRLIARHPSVAEALEISSRVSFAEWIRTDNDVIKDALWNMQTRRLTSIEPGPRTYVPEVIEDAKRNLFDRFAFFGLAERYTDSAFLFAWQLGVRAENADDWPHHNVTRPEERIEPDEESIAYLREINRMDLELYDAALREFKKRQRAMLLAACGDSVRSRTCTGDAADPSGGVTLDGSTDCDGFSYPQQTRDGTPYRWTCASRATVDVPVPVGHSGRVRVRVRCVSSEPSCDRSALRLSMDLREPVSPRLEAWGQHGFEATADLEVETSLGAGVRHALHIHGPVAQTQNPDDEEGWARSIGYAVHQILID